MVDIGGFLGSLFGSAAGASMFKSAYDDLQDIGSEAQAGALQIGEDAASRSEYIPFGVTTSGLGGVQTTADGSTNINLSPEQIALQNQYQGLAQQGTGQFNYGQLDQNRNEAFNQAQGMLSGLGSDMGQREMDVYNRIRATQTPEENRQRLQLEERLAAQGRTGVRTSMYGGTPEQLALAKAQEEAQNSASLMALQQAQAEQQQQYGQAMGLSQLGMSGIGTGIGMAQQALTSQYAPQAAMLSAMSPALNVASLANAAQQNAANLYGTAGISGLEANLGANLGAANMLGNLGAGLFSGSFNPTVTGDGDVVGGLFNSLF